MNIFQNRLAQHLPFIGLFFLLILAWIVSNIWNGPRIFIDRNTIELGKDFRIINDDLMQKIDSFEIVNDKGTVKLSKIDTTNWQISEYPELETSKEFVLKFIDQLKNFKLKRRLKYDSLGLTSYALKNPLSIIKMYSKGTIINEVHFGLYNSIDHSTYLILNKEKYIFQVEALDFNIPQYSTKDFIETKIFPMDFSKVKNITILKDTKLIKNINNELIDINSSFIKILASIRSEIIVDKIDKEGENYLNKALKNYWVKINIDDFSVEISHILAKGFAGTKREDSHYVAVKTNKAKNLFIIKKIFIDHIFEKI